VLWRQEPDDTGSNWNARIERISSGSLNNFGGWDVVPNLRERLARPPYGTAWRFTQ
jgi:hypothetical protein